MDDMMKKEIDIIRGKSILAAQVGDKYIFGHEVNLDDEDPDAFDCSELVEWFFAQFGIVVPDGSYNQYPHTTPVVSPMSFDLGFCLKNGRPYHVAICYDHVFMVHAKNSKSGVVIEPLTRLSKWEGYDGWRRLKCLL